MRKLLLLLVLTFSASARAADPTIAFESYTLPNGLTVILSEDHRLPQVAVNIWYHVGAANQTPGKSGFAHLFEHMMFSGSKHVQPSPFAVLESIGTSAGAMANGTTSFDRTNYFEVVPSSELPTALWLEADRMGFLLETLDAKKLAVQRDVVSNERRQSYENRPYGTAQLRQCDLLYPAPHPYYNCVIGTIEEIQSATVDDLRAFFTTWYTPRNASLAIVGDFDPAQAKKLVERYFGTLPSGPVPPKVDVPQPRLTKVIRETVEDKNVELPQIQIIWNGVKPYTPDEPAGDVLSMILGDGKASRFYRTLVMDKQVASEVWASDAALRLGGYFEIGATANHGHDLKELMPLLQAEIDRIKKDGPTAAEVERAKRKIVASMMRRLERIGGFGGKADMLNDYQMWVGDPGYLPKDLARYRAVTEDQVRDFARAYLVDDKRIELSVVPATKVAQSPEVSR